MVILKELNVKQKAQIERQVLYRSNILSILFHYISNKYKVEAFPVDRIHEQDQILKKIKRDEEFLSLFCFIISKRLVVMDDLEFQGKQKQSKAEKYPFIAFEDIRFTSWILNNIAYRVFWSKFTMA